MTTDPYLDPYRRSAERHGTGFGVTLWANPDTQIRRFEVFAQMIPMHDKRVLDLGCSRGDLAVFLIERKIPFESYLGIDALHRVIDYAQQRRLAHCRFVCADVIADPKVLHTDNPQIICISGTLNTMTDSQVLHTLNAAWAAASEAMIFNFLSDQVGPHAPTQTKPARRFATFDLLRWALQQSPQVSFRQDYFPNGHDATILVRKQSAPTQKAD